jgi:hypothetical protein
MDQCLSSWGRPQTRRPKILEGTIRGRSDHSGCLRRSNRWSSVHVYRGLIRHHQRAKEIFLGFSRSKTPVPSCGSVYLSLANFDLRFGCPRFRSSQTGVKSIPLIQPSLSSFSPPQDRGEAHPDTCLWRINTEADFQALHEKARSSQRFQWQ